MTNQHNLVMEAVQRGAVPGRGYALARVISQVFHPVLLSVINVFLVGLFAVPGTLIGLGWSALSVALQIIPGTAFFMIRLRQGAYSDEDVSVRQQRNELYLFSMVTVLVGLLVFVLLGAPRPFVALFCTVAVVNATCWLINLFWKISVHAVGVAGTAFLASIYSPGLGMLLWGGALAVGWARVRTRNHTPAQVGAGFVLAVVAMLGVFALFGLL